MGRKKVKTNDLAAPSSNFDFDDYCNLFQDKYLTITEPHFQQFDEVNYIMNILEENDRLRTKIKQLEYMLHNCKQNLDYFRENYYLVKK
jgi:hypothetical protein